MNNLRYIFYHLHHYSFTNSSVGLEFPKTTKVIQMR